MGTSIQEAGCSVELHSLGFVVMFEDRPMPRMMPGQVVIFAGRIWARELAAAIDANEMDRCHEIIAQHGRVYEVVS